ncbi:kinase-like domain-containing protein [Mycena sp. CBHHK59/15]|nr:kinase-like domain-containing protein [Mycena sp. CBHHK59/15]
MPRGPPSIPSTSPPPVEWHGRNGSQAKRGTSYTPLAHEWPDTDSDPSPPHPVVSECDQQAKEERQGGNIFGPRAGERPTAESFEAVALRAPEVFLRSDVGPGLDIWAVGCLTFELLVGRWLFNPEQDKELTVEDDHLAKMMELTGEDGLQKFPQSMLDRAKGNLLKIKEDDLVPASLETAMGNCKIPDLSSDVIDKAAHFMRACLRLDYTERATAKDRQNHHFLSM